MSAPNTTQSSAVVNGTLPHGNGVYRLKDVPLGTPDHLRIRMIGAGASGLNMARHVELHMKNVDFMIYEKNDEVAGTWYENRWVIGISQLKRYRNRNPRLTSAI